MNIPDTRAVRLAPRPERRAPHWSAGVRKTMRQALRCCWPLMIGAAFATAASAQTEQLRFSFASKVTGSSPQDNGNLLALKNGHLIGTAQNGGSKTLPDEGVVFEEIPPTATNPNWTYHELYHFQGGPADGYGPFNGLTEGKKGVLYGVTAWGGNGSSGGVGGCGVVYQLSPPALTGTGKWEESVIYYFGSQTDDGCKPTSTQLLFDKTTGSLFGTTELGGGTAGAGTLFQLTPPAQAGGLWTETVLYRFTGGLDGRTPSGAITGNPDGGIVYGTTLYGGEGSGNGNGVVWAYYSAAPAEMTTIYYFQGGTDAASPTGGVIGPYSYGPLGDSYYLLGTSPSGGGSANCTNGCGTVFVINLPFLRDELATDGILHAFQGTDGDSPMEGLAPIGGAYWGTTEGGGGSSNCGGYGCGTLFKIQVSGFTHYTLSYAPVYNFQGGTADGAFPTTGLAGDSSGNVYGTTTIGGANNLGTLFEYTP